MTERWTRELDDSDSPDGSLIGHAVGGYRVRALIGHGGMGAVYLAVHPVLGKRVAIKLLLPEAMRSDSRRRFLDEARALAALDSPYIVAVHDLAALADGRAYLAMEYIEGESLSSLLRRRGRLPAGEAIAIADQVLAGLATAHARGIVHRDIKPGNLLLARPPGGPPRMKVLDFGIAKLVGLTALATTRSGAVLGTAAYMAPEQARGEAEVDARADLYAVGIVLYELVSGRVPFDGPWLEVLAKHQHAPPPPLDLPGLPAKVEAAILRALAKEPDTRFADAQEMREALVAAAGGRDALPPLPDPEVSELLPEPRAELERADDGRLEPRADSGTPEARANSAEPKPRSDGARPASLESTTPLRKQAAIEAHRAAVSRRPRSWVRVAVAGAIIVAALASAVVFGHRGSDLPLSLLESSCEDGAAASCEQLGRAYWDGAGVEPNTSRAFALLDRACSAGRPEACAKLGVAYEKGRGTKADLDRAAKLYRSACDDGSGAGCSSLSRLYYWGSGLDKDRARSAALARRACEIGSIRGCYDWGFALVHGEGVAKDVARGAELLRRACATTIADACNELGTIYEDGKLGRVDLDRAARLYRRGCDGGSGIACGSLGNLYYWGTGFAKDRARSASLYETGCARGSHFGCYSWGFQLIRGDGVATDPTRGAALMQQACERGQENSCALLGSFYAKGSYLPADLARAITLYRKGCKAGSALGCAELASRLARGDGVPADLVEAERLYKLACADGHDRSCKALAELQHRSK